MYIKPQKTEKIEFDIKEWNDNVKAYIKPLNGFERLEFNDFFIAFYNKENTPDDRFDAGFRAALLTLVTDGDAPLLTEADRDAVRSGSFVPFFRLFNAILNQYDETGKELDTIKKN